MKGDKAKARTLEVLVQKYDTAGKDYQILYKCMKCGALQATSYASANSKRCDICNSSSSSLVYMEKQDFRKMNPSESRLSG